MDKDRAIALLLDQLGRAALVIANQHRVHRDYATMKRIAGELRDTCRACAPDRTEGA